MEKGRQLHVPTIKGLQNMPCLEETCLRMTLYNQNMQQELIAKQVIVLPMEKSVKFVYL